MVGAKPPTSKLNVCLSLYVVGVTWVWLRPHIHLFLIETGGLFKLAVDLMQLFSENKE